MTYCAFNLLEEPLIAASLNTAASHNQLTLPGLLAALARDEVESLPALRPHQAPLWHMFLVQLAGLALRQAGQRDAPEDVAEWARLLRGLTADFPGDEPWCLVVDDWSKPAFMQPPVPEGMALLKRIDSPDALDLLITAKNHEFKQAVARTGQPGDWALALVTHQTGGTYDVKNRNAVRTGNIYAPRICMGLAPLPPDSAKSEMSSMGDWFRRDVRVLLADREKKEELPLDYPLTCGLGLTWLVPWEGGEQLRTSDLDMWFIEICRRIRLRKEKHRIAAMASGSNTVERINIDGIRSGLLGDPWTPVHKTNNNGYALSGKGFHYSEIVDIIFGKNNSHNWFLPLLMESSNEELSAKTLLFVAQGIAGHKKKTGTLGFHSRAIPLGGKVLWAIGPKRKELHQLAEAQINIIAKFDEALRCALVLAVAGGEREKIKNDYNEFTNTARAHLDRYADEIFFKHLWATFEAHEDGPEAEEAERTRFSDKLWRRTKAIFDQALPAMPCAGLFRPRAEVRARRMLKAMVRKAHPELFVHEPLQETDEEDISNAAR